MQSVPVTTNGQVSCAEHLFTRITSFEGQEFLVYTVSATDDWLTTTTPPGTRLYKLPRSVYHNYPAIANCTEAYVDGVPETKAIVQSFTDVTTTFVGKKPPATSAPLTTSPAALPSPGLSANLPSKSPSTQTPANSIPVQTSGKNAAAQTHASSPPLEPSNTEGEVKISAKKPPTSIPLIESSRTNGEIQPSFDNLKNPSTRPESMGIQIPNTPTLPVTVSRVAPPPLTKGSPIVSPNFASQTIAPNGNPITPLSYTYSLSLSTTELIIASDTKTLLAQERCSEQTRRLLLHCT